MKNLQKYNQMRKKKLLAMLDELAKGIRTGRLVLDEQGFWASNMDNSLYFKIKVICRDKDKESRKFGQFL